MKFNPKQYINYYLSCFCAQNSLTLLTEHKFLKDRRYRFDWAIPELMIAIEYEGIFNCLKSRHTTLKGYSSDLDKYNLAVTNGWKVLRYSALNFKNLPDDTEKLLQKMKLDNRKKIIKTTNKNKKKKRK